MRVLISTWRPRRTIFLATSVALLGGCGSSSDTPPTPPLVPGTLTVAVAPASLALTAGTAGSTTATIVRGGSFAGDVQLAAEGAPSGVTVTFTPSTLGAGFTSSTVSIVTTAGAAVGTNPIAIKATGSGVTVAAATLSLTVNAPAQTPTVSMVLAPVSGSIAAGGSATAVATITRGGGFTGPVTLSAPGLPAGVTVAFSRAVIPDTATTSTVTVSVAGTQAAGAYSAVINAAGTAVTSSATYAVTVPPPVVGTNITVSYCAADAPLWLAVQDGTGPWTRVTPNTGTNTYQFSLASGRGGLAVVDTTGSAFGLSVTYATTAEFGGFDQAVQLGGCGFKTVNGTVANVAPTQLASVTLGYSTKSVIPILSSTFSLTNVASGPQSLFAARLEAGTLRADKMILRRGLDIANNGTLATLDFNATEAFAPASGTVSVTGLGADTASILSLFNGVRGSTFGIIGTFGPVTSSSGPLAYDAVPDTRLVTDELQQLLATVDGMKSSRTSGIYYRTPGAVTLAMGPALSAPTVTRITGGNYPRVRVQLPLQTEYDRSFESTFTQSNANRSAEIFATAAYTGGGAWDITLPDVSGAAGWNPIWGMVAGQGIDWSAGANGGALYLLDRTVVSGTTFRGAQRQSSSPLP